MDEQQAVMEYLRTLGIDTPEALQEFALTGQTPTMLGMAGQDYETGLGLSQTPSAEGQRVGGTYVAANPLEHLAAAIEFGGGSGPLDFQQAPQELRDGLIFGDMLAVHDRKLGQAAVDGTADIARPGG